MALMLLKTFSILQIVFVFNIALKLGEMVSASDFTLDETMNSIEVELINIA
jgi:hypothetical protein